MASGGRPFGRPPSCPLRWNGKGKTMKGKGKTTTATPEGIASPDKVETRLGTLNFFDGTPDGRSPTHFPLQLM